MKHERLNWNRLSDRPARRPNRATHETRLIRSWSIAGAKDWARADLIHRIGGRAFGTPIVE